MQNRILDAYVATRHADPAGAELRIIVRPERITPATEIKGRLTGPHSPYAGTVEIAYPLRELARTDHILLRVLIPEPSWWEPKTPLLYEGPLELWEEGQRCEQISLRHGIRAVQLGVQGVRVNGTPMRLSGVVAETFTEEDARRWHDEGINLVLIPARDENMNLWRLSDRFGLFVLGRIDEAHQWPRWPMASHRHPSNLGCVLSPQVTIHQREAMAGAGLLGAQLGPQSEIQPGRYDFLLVEGDDRSTMILPATIDVAAMKGSPLWDTVLLGRLRRE